MNHKQMERRETQKHQAAARGKGLHPRRLARSMAKFINRKEGAKENEISGYREDVAIFMRNQKTVKPKRTVRKIG